MRFGEVPVWLFRIFYLAGGWHMPYSMGTEITVFWTLLNIVPCISLFFFVVEPFYFFIIIYIFNFIYLFLATLGFHCCA